MWITSCVQISELSTVKKTLIGREICYAVINVIDIWNIDDRFPTKDTYLQNVYNTYILTEPKLGHIFDIIQVSTFCFEHTKDLEITNS